MISSLVGVMDLTLVAARLERCNTTGDYSSVYLRAH